MNISTKAIVSNSDMIKNYRDCRDKAQSIGKIFILKNNQPDAVLFSINEYDRLSAFIEYLETLDEKDMDKLMEILPKQVEKRIYPVDLIKKSIVEI